MCHGSIKVEKRCTKTNVSLLTYLSRRCNSGLSKDLGSPAKLPEKQLQQTPVTQHLRQHTAVHRHPAGKYDAFVCVITFTVGIISTHLGRNRNTNWLFTCENTVRQPLQTQTWLLPQLESRPSSASAHPAAPARSHGGCSSV